MPTNKTAGRRALGRGLSNLIPTVDIESEANLNEIHLVDSNVVIPNPFQPRTDFKEDEIKGLAESIRSQGLLQPIVVRKNGEKFEIISGERRFRAMRILEYDKIPCIVKPHASDSEMLELALVENVQREDLNEIEKAYAYQKLLDECGLSHEELSRRIGKGRTVVTNTLRLLKLPDEIQQQVRCGSLTMGHARALLGLEDEKQQLAMASKIMAENLSVRDVEAKTKAIKNAAPSAVPPRGAPGTATLQSDADMDSVIERLRYRFGTDISIKNNSRNKGTVSIAFYSKEDLNRIIDILVQ
jgi:ParB family chromosome partitioning protein